MSRRNIWLSFSEWELIRSELTPKNNNSFYLNEKEIKEWKEEMKSILIWDVSEEKARHRFERCYIHGVLDELTSPKACNVLCREYWRSGDLWNMTRSLISFVGFITNYAENVDMNTTKEQWEDIRTKMMDAMTEVGQVYWVHSEIVDVYNKVVSNQLVTV
jgi:hypothetical protein